MKTAENLSLEHLKSEIEKKDQTIAYLTEQLEWFKRQIFGKRSERIISDLDSKQILFEGFDNQEAESEISTKETSSKIRKKPNRNAQDAITIPSDLPVKTVVLDLPEEEKVCKKTGVKLVQIGKEITHKLAHEPGSYYIKEIIRPKYAYPKEPEKGIITAELPDSIIPKCRADNSLLAEIVTKKFADHMPLYRVAEEMKRNKVGISRKLLSQWVIKAGMSLQVLYEVMKQKILFGKSLYIDESPVKLQEKEKCQNGYIWTIVGFNPEYRVYQFCNNRCHSNAENLIKGYLGVVHSDKYGAYQSLAEKKKIIWSPCWVHIRRKFIEAESGDPPFRQWVLRKIKYLFMLEKIAWTRSSEERLKIRKEKEEPLIDELIDKIKQRLTEGKQLPKSNFKKALGYFCGLIPYLKTYLQYPHAKMENNTAERAIRPLAIGRKNWLFFGSENGGKAGAILLSFVQTCRCLGVNPREYLEDIFQKIMGHPANKLEQLLPDQWLLAKQKNQSE